MTILTFLALCTFSLAEPSTTESTTSDATSNEEAQPERPPTNLPVGGEPSLDEEPLSENAPPPPIEPRPANDAVTDDTEPNERAAASETQDPFADPNASASVKPTSLPEAEATPVVAPPPAPPPKEPRPIRWRLDTGFGITGTVVGDVTYEAFSTRQTTIGPEFSVRWDYRVAPRIFIGVGASYQRFASGRALFSDLIVTDLVAHEPQLRGRISVMPIEGIDLFAEVGGGPTILFDTVGTSQAGGLQSRSVLGSFAALGGLSLYLPKSWLMHKQASRVSAGLDLGFGYMFRSDHTVEPRHESDERIELRNANFGALALRGFLWRAGIFVRFM